MTDLEARLAKSKFEAVTVATWDSARWRVRSKETRKVLGPKFRLRAEAEIFILGLEEMRSAANAIRQQQAATA